MNALLFALAQAVLIVVDGFFAYALLDAASSPDPAAVLALYGSGVRGIGWALLVRPLRAAASVLGMWRCSAVATGKPVYAPTWIGAWIGWRLVRVLERLADEDLVRVVRPDLRETFLDEVRRCRGCLEGTCIWHDPGAFDQEGSP
jgi:hypothetical protein